MNKINYQKELDRLIEKFKRKIEYQSFYYIAAAHRAAAIVLNICPVILKSRYFIIIRIFIRQRNIRRVQTSSSALSGR